MRIKEESLILKTNKELKDMEEYLEWIEQTPAIRFLIEQIRKEIKDRLEFYS